MYKPAEATYPSTIPQFRDRMDHSNFHDKHVSHGSIITYSTSASPNPCRSHPSKSALGSDPEPSVTSEAA